jgi:hypothetical protein
VGQTHVAGDQAVCFDVSHQVEHTIPTGNSQNSAGIKTLYLSQIIGKAKLKFN